MRVFKNILKIILILIILVAGAYVLVRVQSKKAEKVRLDEIVVDSEKVNKLCEKFGEEIYFYPGNSKNIKVVKNLTEYQGVDYSLVYNPQYFYMFNEKAREACGADAQKLIQYFVKEGMKKGVRGNEEFDVASYYNSSKDLREQFGPELEKYYMHYIKTGHNEPNRKVKGVQEIEDPITVYNDFDYAKVFDLKYYMEHYPELHHKLTIVGPTGCVDDAKAIEHFVESGIGQFRQANETFDLVSYFLLNPDLHELYKDNLLGYVIHYVNHGPEDKRPALGNHNVEEFSKQFFELKPTIEKETINMLDYLGHDLYSAYAWCAGIDYESLPLNWSTEGYALYAYGNWCGNCYAKASALYYMAKQLGYDAHLVSGYVPLHYKDDDATYYGPHGWVEINGWVYDPDFETETGMNGYQIYYGEPDTWQYSSYWYMA